MPCSGGRSPAATPRRTRPRPRHPARGAPPHLSHSPVGYRNQPMAGTGSRSAYVGREVELDRLTRRLEAAAEGRGGVVVLRGPSGVGTTRTAHEIAGRADRLGMTVLWGQTVDGLSGRPYGAIAEALEELGTSSAGRPPACTPCRRRAAAGAVCVRACATCCPTSRRRPLWRRSDERLRLYDVVVGWLRRAAARPPNPARAR